VLKLTISSLVPLVLLCMFYNNRVNFKKGSKVGRHQVHGHKNQEEENDEYMDSKPREENDEYMDINYTVKP
jgi:hypothetical protein